MISPLPEIADRTAHERLKRPRSTLATCVSSTTWATLWQPDTPNRVRRPGRPWRRGDRHARRQLDSRARALGGGPIDGRRPAASAVRIPVRRRCRASRDRAPTSRVAAPSTSSSTASPCRRSKSTATACTRWPRGLATASSCSSSGSAPVCLPTRLRSARRNRSPDLAAPSRNRSRVLADGALASANR